MTIVRLQNAGKQYGDRWVFRNVSFTIGARERWGVVGRNGVGKTTLLRAITGEGELTEGDAWLHPGLRFTLLRQNRGEQSAATVHEAALEPFAELVAMEARINRELEQLGEAKDAAEAERLLKSYDRHVEEFRRRGGYEMRSRADATLEGLGFPPETWEKPIRALSGGELGRLRLVQTLLYQPDVLLLDEPTNHLDLRSTEWLEEFIRGYPGTVLLVSHDRVFLERLADHVLHLEEGTAYAYTGGYESFLDQREARRELQRKQFEQQQAMIARTEDFIRRNVAGQKTKQAKSRRTLLSRMERIAAVGGDEKAMALRFASGGRSGGVVMRLDGVQCAYGDRVLFAPFSAEVSRTERIAIVGPNGCGKSTLMRVLAGVGEARRGSVTMGTGVRTAYYRQDFTHLNPDHKVREAVAEAAPSLTFPELRNHLGRFLFSGDEQEARVGDLSGGEQARVALARITLQKANLLLLDEPTNHLDIESREVLEEALEGYDGTVILISHDRAMLSAVSTRVWAWEDGRFVDYPGGFDEWLEWSARRKAESAANAALARVAEPKAGALTASGAGANGARTSALSKNEIRRREREMEELEARIQETEARIGEIETSLGDPALYAAGADPARPAALATERDTLQARLAEAYAAWERVGEELAGV
ncbi:ABC-F family ATP-binding cassette domain-containing protein [Longimicrobium sp.]|uniref:ABC-F family ATP-binding cassette domain-containing protein n=1 Tax=Longimicrobium sp. TaxID=2029185 RepID=UPI002E35B481|nr:ABC-F family ATP-binding cassette domain-containing protein [Longimicrobium sp.]HEX6039734.1 ABC-F family ATP-binding cassette domain-containing protein [Longimicrobium sp.]